MTQQLNGQFQITDWQETTTFQNDDGQKVTTADIKQTYTGELQGTSKVQYVMCYTSDSHALFTGFEVITVEQNGTVSTLTLQHTGEFKNGVAVSEFKVVEGTGTGTYSGSSGNGQFGAGEGGKANYQLTLD